MNSSRENGTPARAQRRVCGVIRGLERLATVLRIVLDDEPERPQNRHRAPGAAFEIGSDARLQPLELHRAVVLGHPDPLAEIA